MTYFSWTSDWVIINRVTADSPHDEWATANALLANPDLEVPRGVVKARQKRILIVVVGVLLAAGIGAAVGLAFPDGATESTDVPVLQFVIGLVIAASGLVLQFWGVRRQWKRGSALNYWRGPLAGLTRSQRKRLLQQVRGRVPVQPETERLSVLQAHVMIHQRLTTVGNCGLAVLWLGLFISSPTIWRATLALFLILLVASATPFIERDARAAERFISKARSS